MSLKEVTHISRLFRTLIYVGNASIDAYFPDRPKASFRAWSDSLASKAVASILVKTCAIAPSLILLNVAMIPRRSACFSAETGLIYLLVKFS